MKRRKKTCTINIRARKADIALLDQAARAVGVSRSAIIRNAAEMWARRILSLPNEAKP
jgi:uncharacterized protein (DUF1778 family)